MRPGQNKRLRGRSNNSNHGRKGPNPLTRSFESNGPDVKIRGTAQHIAEKYLQLARDAQSSGDPVMAENYLQHAEHYYRVIAAAQQAQQQAMGLLPKPAQEVEDEDEGVEEDDRFASVADRLPQPPQMQQPFQGNQPNTSSPQAFQGQPNGGGQSYGGPQQGGERPQFGSGERQHSGERQQFGGGERQQGGGQRPWRDRNEGRGDRPDYRDNNRGERGDYRGNEQRNDNRGNEQRSDNRGNEQRSDNRSNEQRSENRGNEQRADNRSEQRNDNRSEQRSETAGERQDRPDRGNGGQQMRHERRGPRTDVEDVPDGAAALPSFITGGLRPASESAAPTPEQGEFAGPEGGDAQGYHLRPRRRRRGRPENAGENEFGGGENNDTPPSPETTPVSD